MRNMAVAGPMGVMVALATLDVAARVTGWTILGASTEKTKTLAQEWSAKK